MAPIGALSRLEYFVSVPAQLFCTKKSTLHSWQLLVCEARRALLRWRTMRRSASIMVLMGRLLLPPVSSSPPALLSFLFAGSVVVLICAGCRLRFLVDFARDYLLLGPNRPKWTDPPVVLRSAPAPLLQRIADGVSRQLARVTVSSGPFAESEPAPRRNRLILET